MKRIVIICCALTAITAFANYSARNTFDVNAQGGTNQFDHNFMGLISELTDAKGNQTGFEYDLLGRLINKKYADNSSLNYQYNAIGNLVKRTDAKDQITAYAYDLQGRLATNSYYPSSASYPSSPAKTVSFSHDAWGRMAAWNDGTYQGAFNYNDTNRTRSITVDFGPFSKTITYGYNAWGQKISCQYPDGTEYKYTYNGENRLTGITIPNEGEVSFSANQYGMPTLVILPGGTVKSFGYDALNRLATNAVFDPAAKAVMSRSYARNIIGNITGQQTEYGNYEYQYDVIDQLTNALAPYCAEGFAYDLMGNRFYSKYAGNETNEMEYSANNLNQYLSVTSVVSVRAYSYDLNGNQLTYYRQATNGWTTNYLVWDIEDRLTAITNQEGEVARYTYDPFGRRLSKVVNGNTNYYLYADEGLIGEYDSAGNEICSYGYQPNSLWMNNPVWMHTTIPSLNDGGTNYLYYLNDHLGAPQTLVRKNGAVAWAAAMDAFGNVHVLPGAVVTNNLRFSSQYYDEESGLHYNTMRYYDPVSGRFLSRDPIGELGGLNVYRFLGNDPLDYIDAYGLACSWAVGRCVRNVGNIAMPDEVTIDGKVVKIPRWVSEAVNVSVPDHHDVKVESYSGENCSGKVEESMVRGFFADNFTDSLLQYAAFLITFGRVDGYVPGGVKDSALTAGSCSMSCVKKERFDKVKQRITTSKASRYHLTRYNCQIWATEQLAP